MNCPHCKHPFAEGRNYCGACGNLLVQYCRLCGFRNATADRFCGGCGGSLTEALQEPATRQEGVPAAPPEAPPPAAEPGPAAAAISDLLEAARETEEVAQSGADVRVSQDDIDSLFGD